MEETANLVLKLLKRIAGVVNPEKVSEIYYRPVSSLEDFPVDIGDDGTYVYYSSKNVSITLNNKDFYAISINTIDTLLNWEYFVWYNEEALPKLKELLELNDEEFELLIRFS